MLINHPGDGDGGLSMADWTMQVLQSVRVEHEREKTRWWMGRMVIGMIWNWSFELGILQNRDLWTLGVSCDNLFGQYGYSLFRTLMIMIMIKNKDLLVLSAAVFFMQVRTYSFKVGDACYSDWNPQIDSNYKVPHDLAQSNPHWADTTVPANAVPWVRDFGGLSVTGHGFFVTSLWFCRLVLHLTLVSILAIQSIVALFPFYWSWYVRCDRMAVNQLF